MVTELGRLLFSVPLLLAITFSHPATAKDWGEAGSSEFAFKDDQGHSSSFHFYSPDAGGQSSRGLIVYLHGDTAGEYHSLWPAIKAQAAARGLRAVSVKAVACNGELRWWYCVNENSHYLNSVLARIAETYGVEKSKILFSGQSGGSTFLGSWYLPKYGEAYGGGALLACPGKITELDKPGVFSAAPTTSDFKVRVLTSELDKLKAIHGPGALSMANRWKRAGYQTQFHESAGRQHCDFDKPFETHLGETADWTLKSADAPMQSRLETMPSTGKLIPETSLAQLGTVSDRRVPPEDASYVVANGGDTQEAAPHAAPAALPSDAQIHLPEGGPQSSQTFTSNPRRRVILPRMANRWRARRMARR